MNCLNDQNTKVRYTAATALAAYLKHNCDNTQLLNVYRDCLPCLISVGFTYKNIQGGDDLSQRESPFEYFKVTNGNRYRVVELKSIFLV